MPADHSKHGFLKDIGTDWVALSPNGAPLARAATEAGVRRAVPDAAEYITGQGDPNVKSTGEGKAHKAAPRPEPALAVEPVSPEPVAVEPVTDTTTASADTTTAVVDPRLDPDGDGKMGGSQKGENATASRSRRQRRPA